MSEIFEAFNISSERKIRIIEEISQGSEPRGVFYILLLTSTLIAGFGLIANSTAVVIGAMLVSPLMTPIQGISLAMIRGNGRLMGHAVRSELVGAALAICVSALLGILPLNVEATPEMLARTHPNLIDLLVAVLAGFAGALAMVDERISPALPGVAIATAIVPPLANCGLCLGLRAYAGALGSFLLFFANFLSILLISAVVYILAGLSVKWKFASPWDFVRRFGPVILGFILVGVFLTHALIVIVHSRKVEYTIRNVLDVEFKKNSIASMDNILTSIRKESVDVLAMIRSAQLVSPDQVKDLEDILTQKLEKKVHLVVRNTLAKDIGPTGRMNQVTHQTLDDPLEEDKTSERLQIVRNVEQTLWEKLLSRPDFQLLGVDYGQLSRGRVIFVTLQGLRPPTAEEIQITEKTIQERLMDDRISLVVRFMPGTFWDRNGEVLYGWTRYGGRMEDNKQLYDRIRNAVRDVFKADHPGLIPGGVHFNASRDPLAVLIEVSAKGTLSPEKRVQIEKAIIENVRHPLRVSLWVKSEVVWTPTGETSIKDLLRTGWEQNERQAIQEWMNLNSQ